MGESPPAPDPVADREPPRPRPSRPRPAGGSSADASWWLEEVRRRAAAALAITGAGVVIIDRADRSLCADGVAARLLGVAKGREIPGDRLSERVHVEDHEAVVSCWFEGDLGNVPTEPLRFRVVGDGGTPLWRTTMVAAIDEAPDLLQGVIADIDREVRREEDLRRLRANLETAQSMTWIGDWETVLAPEDPAEERIVWSEGLYRIFGVDPSEGPIRVSRILERTHPEDREEVAAAIERMRQAPVGAVIPPFEHRIIRPDGAVRHVHVLVRKEHGLQPGEGRVFGVVQDITERHETEERLRRSAERFRQLVQASPEIVFRTDARGHVTFSDDERWEKLSGRRAGEWRGEGWLDSVHPEDRAATERELARATAAGEPYELRFRVVHVDGRVAHMFSRAMPVRNADGETIDYVGISTDVTPLIESEAEKQALRDELLQAQKLEALGTLASGVAHDFNNQIMVIQGYVDLARRQLDDGSPVRGFLDRVQRASEAALEVTEGLLTFARKRDGEREPVDLSSLLRDGLALLRPIVPAAIAFREALPAEPVWVEASEIQQILANLVVNARDAMPEGGSLAVSLRMEPDLERPVCFEVADDGLGMPEEVRARVFEPFFTTKPPGRGTGLGLSMIHGMVTSFGGSIEVTSRPGEGTVVRVCLPQTERRPAPDSPADEGAHSGGGETLLVVEDNALIRELIVSTCSLAGYTVVEAADGKEALDVFARVSDSISLALLDVDLPHRNGVACARAMRAARPDLPVVYLTGNRGNPALDEAHPDDPVYEKPCHGEKLLRALAARLEAVERTSS